MKKITFFAFAITLIAFSSCTPIKTIVDTSCPGYKSPEFEKKDLSMEGVGIMPVLGGSEKEQYRRPMGDAIYTAFSNRYGKENIKSTKQVISILNENNLIANYTAAINDYKTTGIVPKDMVHQIQEVLDVRYLLYLNLLSDSEAEVITTGDYSSVVRVDELYVQCQIWDCDLGDVVWEGKGGVAVLPDEHQDIISLTAKGLAEVVGNEIHNGPCETKKELIDAVASAKAGTYLATLGASMGISLLVILMFL